jgi:hypothetical protein
MSHLRVQHMKAQLALLAHWAEISLAGRSRRKKFYDLTDLNRKMKQRSKR